jgi:hypothetical protein
MRIGTFLPMTVLGIISVMVPRTLAGFIPGYWLKWLCYGVLQIASFYAFGALYDLVHPIPLGSFPKLYARRAFLLITSFVGGEITLLRLTAFFRIEGKYQILTFIVSFALWLLLVNWWECQWRDEDRRKRV